MSARSGAGYLSPAENSSINAQLKRSQTLSKVWFITGCSRGFGKTWASSALARGDRVIATARDPSTLEDLVVMYGKQILPLKLDVCNRNDIHAVVSKGVEVFGQIDVVVNNAGYGLFCSVEDAPEAEVRNIFETNFLGQLWVIQEVLPVLRKQGHGHIVQISSIAGLLALPGIGIYNSTKWALEGLIETLANEVRDFGIKVTLVEPGPHLTDWIGKSAVHPPRSPFYPSQETLREKVWPAMVPAAPESTIDAMLGIVDSEDPPLRFLLGNDLKPMIQKDMMQRLECI